MTIFVEREKDCVWAHERCCCCFCRTPTPCRTLLPDGAKVTGESVACCEECATRSPTRFHLQEGQPMSDYQFTRIVTKPVTVQREHKETAVLPVLDLTVPVVLEALDGGRGTVILNSVILKGASLTDVRTTTNWAGKREGSATLQTPFGRVQVPVSDCVITDGFEPTTVGWKVEEPEGFCCIGLCGKETIVKSSKGRYYCTPHFEQLHPSKR